MKYIFILFFLLGCSSKEMPTPTPKWVLNPPSNVSYFYGVGQGWDLEEAKTLAINDLSSKLQLSINSSFSLILESEYDTFSKSSKSEINTQVHELELDNIKVEKSVKTKDSFYALVSINKSKFIKKQKEIFLHLDNKIDSKVKELLGSGTFEKYLKIKKMQSLLKKAKNKAYFLKAIDRMFEHKKFISKYTRLQNLQSQLQNKVEFQVKDNIKKSFFRNKLTKKINSIGFKVKKKKNNNNLEAIMTHKVRYFKYKEWYTAKVDTFLNMIEDKKVLLSYETRFNGKSTVSKEDALINASKRFDFVF